jgi:Ca2+-dependent lipid-binding protein
LIPGSIEGATAYVPPIGIMRIWLKKAVDLKNLESALGGKSDPYIRALCNHQIHAKTEVIDNSLSPEWDEVVYVPIHHPNDKVLLEIMDHQNLTKDRHLGAVEVKVSDYATLDASNHETPYISVGPRDRVAGVQLGSGQGEKGRLHYQATFISAIALRDGVKFDAVANASALLGGNSNPIAVNPIANSADAGSVKPKEVDEVSLIDREQKQSVGISMGFDELLQERESRGIVPDHHDTS